MSAPVIQPLAPGREQGSVGAPRGEGATRSTRKISLVGLLLTACLAGCSHDNGITTQPIPTASKSTATSSPTVVDEGQVVLAQYRAFWASLSSFSKMPVTARRAGIEKYAINPELGSVLEGMAKLDAKGEVLYGQNLPRPTVELSPDGLTAVVDDCQDSSHAGTANRRTMRPLNKGQERNHVVVTMKKASDVWKLAFVAYTTKPC
jgi:hypothetical protein